MMEQSESAPPPQFGFWHLTDDCGATPKVFDTGPGFKNGNLLPLYTQHYWIFNNAMAAFAADPSLCNNTFVAYK